MVRNPFKGLPVKAMVKELFVDLVGVSGLALLFYGLYQLYPWLAFSVTGVLLIVFAVFASK